MCLKLGEIPVVVISSADGAAEVMKFHDLEFASRPINYSVEAIFYGGNNVLFGPYGDFWRQMRRLCNLELLSPKRVRSFRAVREQEVSTLIREISEKANSGVVVDFSSSLAEVSNNVMARAAIGGRCEDQSLFHSLLGTAVKLLSGFNLVDLFPSMPFIGRITGHQRRLDECRKNLDLMAEKSCRNTEKNGAESPVDYADLTEVLLRIQREGGLQFPLSDDNIKAVINVTNSLLCFPLLQKP
ncbi:hypothetical protein HPP92_028389 [Vanilla planifolia]|uniref:Cytochrome P450 n=1 Tax=Vanilla planifolia TaxID=51239 RepID=A0A835P7G8_VANPL|nr:hypothetical protein HPP92_028389 [Vanilla planifolia]KAG0477193.1 hypothetical protein HPP92_014034 [Vanilla planifolia]